MNFQEFLKDQKADGADRSSEEDVTPYDESESTGTDSSEQADATDQGAPSPGNDQMPSQEKLMEAYKQAEALAMEKAQEAQGYRRALEQMDQDRQMLMQRSEDEAFLRDMRNSYEKDPVGTMIAMIGKSQHQTHQAMEARFMHAIQEQHDFKRLMDGFLNQTENARLKPYEQELEFLVRDRGLHVKEAATLLRSIENKMNSHSRKRSAASKEIRNRSMVESGGDVGEPVDRDKEFNRMLNKAKSLDEMFAGLRKLKGK